jgi:hypothetical protein
LLVVLAKKENVFNNEENKIEEIDTNIATEIMPSAIFIQ